jgi:hypothetical protein
VWLHKSHQPALRGEILLGEILAQSPIKPSQLKIFPYFDNNGNIIWLQGFNFSLELSRFWGGQIARVQYLYNEGLSYPNWFIRFSIQISLFA